MSDIPRRPRDAEPAESGWWKASDGKWYPPESAPTQATPVTNPWEQPPATGTSPVGWRKSWSTRTKWIVGVAAGVLVFRGIAAAVGTEPEEKVNVAPAAPTTDAPSTAAPVTRAPTTTTAAPTTVPRTTPPTTAAPRPKPTSPPATQAPAPPPPPEPEPEPEPVNNCDPNYSGCVPIASDVDCAGGSGNGPAYVDGPVTVIGSDVYDLDGNDNDGIGCES